MATADIRFKQKVEVELQLDKAQAWKLAEELLGPTFERHSLEEKKEGNMFAPNSTVSAAEQRVDLTIRVADWLLEPSNP